MEAVAAGRSLVARRRTQLLVAGVLLAALIARMVYVVATWHYAPFVPDARSYDALARALVLGQGYGGGAYRPPGYPYFLAGLYELVGLPPPLHLRFAWLLVPNRAANNGAWVATRMLEAVLATVSVGLFGWVANQLAGRRVALVAMGVAAVYLPMIVVGVAIQSETLLVPLTLAATGCALRARSAQRPAAWVALTGFLCGLATLTRENAAVVALALAVVVWSGRPRRSLRSLALPLLLLIMMAATVSPWTIRNANALHAFVPVSTELGPTLAGTYNSVSARQQFLWQMSIRYPDYSAIRRMKHLDAAQSDARLTSAVLGYIGRHPAAVPQAMFWNTLRLLDLDGLSLADRTAHDDVGSSYPFADATVYCFWLVALLAIIGMFTRAVRRVPRSVWLVPLLVWLSEAPITIGTPRFRAMMEPYFVLLASFALVALGRLVTPARARWQAAVPPARVLTDLRG